MLAILSPVDVIVPVYNSEDTVESAIASIQAQTIRSIRIIIVNDGSTDGTRRIVERLAGGDERILLIDQENAGIVDALNVGLAACSAPLVARHDSDDLAYPDRFEKQLAYLNEHPDCVAVSGAARHIDEAGQALGELVDLPSPDLADPHAYPQREPYLLHPFLMMRRAAVEAVGGYRHAFHAEDTDLYWRLQEIGRLANMPDLLGAYRIHAQSISGGSLLNGRISALTSQLAGFSAIRRRAGERDIVFTKGALSDYQRARSLENIIRAGRSGLDTGEGERLTTAVCAKLLELASYRPYELEPEDCSFIRKTILRALPEMTSESRKRCSKMLSGTAARLAYGAQISAAIRLAPPRYYPQIAARLALRIVVPFTVLRMMRHALGSAAIMK